MDIDELLKEYNSWINWLNTRGSIDFENFIIEEQDFETMHELAALIDDNLFQLYGIINDISFIDSKINKLLGDINE